MFVNFQKAGWKVCARTFSLALLSFMLLFPSPGGTRGFFIELTNQQINIQMPMLNPSPVLMISERASAAMVRTIMALLATFDEAGVLPPEGTTQANQLIHGLIQLQAAFLNTTSPELSAYFLAAGKHWNMKLYGKYGTLTTAGLTSRALEALILFDKEHPMWEQPKIVAAVQAYNVTGSDWALIVDLFDKANAVFREQGRSMHELYDQWQMKMQAEKS